MSPTRKHVRQARKPALVNALLIALVLVSAPVLLVPSPAPAQQGDRTELREYSIPAGPLNEALTRFIESSGVFLAGNAELTSGLPTRGVQGEYTPEEALRRLLAGTGLNYRFTGSDTVTLAKAGEQNRNGPRRLGPIQVTATRTERPVSSIPGSVTVIDEPDVDKQRQVTRDVLRILQRSVPGFSGATGERGEQGAALRGRTPLILQNGVPQSVQLRTSGFGIRNIDPRQIERIEVVRTANATLGFGGAGGSINIITKRPDSPVPLYTFEVGTEFQPVNLRGENFTKEGYASVEGRDGKLDYLFSASGRDVGTGFDAEGDRIPDSEREFNSESLGLHSSVGWQMDAERALRLDVTYRREQDNEDRTAAANAIPGEKKAEAVPSTDSPFFDPFQAWNASVTFDDANVLGSALNVQAFFQRHQIEAFSDFTGFGACCILSRGEETRIDQRIGGRLNIETPLPNDASIVWGGDIVSNFNSELIDSEIAGTDVGLRPDVTQNNFAVFAQIDIPLGDFLLTGGVRHDRFNVNFEDVLKEDGSAFTGGAINVHQTLFNVGAVYNLTDEIELFTGFSQGLDITQAGRAASQVNSVDQIQLEPATTDSYEVGARYFGDRWDGSVTAFYTESELASRTINPGGALQLAIPLRQPEQIWGMEATLNVELDEQWRVGGIAHYQGGLREVDGDSRKLQGTVIQPVRVAGYTEYNPFDWLSVRLQAEYSSGHDRFPGSTEFGEGKVSDLFLVDFMASAATAYGEFRLGVENLLNNQYVPQVDEATNSTANFIANPGITTRLTYRIEF